MVWNLFLHYKRALKSDFLLTSFFSPVKYRGRNSEKNWLFEKKILKFFWNRKVVWTGMERLALNALKLWKISTKFKANYARSTLKFNTK